MKCFKVWNEPEGNDKKLVFKYDNEHQAVFMRVQNCTQISRAGIC